MKIEKIKLQIRDSECQKYFYFPFSDSDVPRKMTEVRLRTLRAKPKRAANAVRLSAAVGDSNAAPP